MHRFRTLGVGTLLLAVASVSAVAGSVLGAAIGHQIDRNQGAAEQQHGPHLQPCGHLAAVQTPQDLAGYRVEYRHMDRTFPARTVYDPEEHIGVHAGLRPIHF